MPLLNNWILLAILGGLSSNIFHFLSRFVMKENDDPAAYTWYFEVIRLIAFCAFAIFDWQIIFTPFSLIIFLFLGITELLSAYWLMKMHANSHLSISTILSRTRLIWVPIIAYFLIREHLQIHEYIGIAVLFTGVSITVAPHKLLLDKGALYANLGAFMVALNIVLTKMVLPYGSNSVINAISVIPPVLLLPLFMKHPKKRIRATLKKNILAKSFATIFNILAIYLFTVALRIGDASKVTSIYQGMMIFSVLAGIFLLKETKDIKRKLLGTSITLIAVLILSLT